MGNLLSSRTPEQEEFRRCCKANEFEAALRALRHNRKLVDVRVSRTTGDKLLHLLARQAAYASQLRDLARTLAEVMATEGLSMQQIQRKLAKAADQHNNRGQTPLMLACEHGNVECIKALLDAGADPWMGDNVVRRTCTHYAAGTGQASAIETVITHVRDHPTLQTKRSEVARFRVHDVPAVSGMTPLHYAAWRRQIAAVTALTKENASLYARSGPIGADPECPICNESSTPLHLAALKGSHGTVKALLKAYVRQADEQRAAGPSQGLQQQGAGRQRSSAPQEQQQRQQQQQQQVASQRHMQVQEPFVDPRTLLDSLGYTPFAIARAKNHFYMLTDLNPLTPLAQVLAQDSPQDRAIGVPRLQEISAKAAHNILMEQLAKLALELEEAKLRRPPKVPATSIYATMQAPAVNCHAALLLQHGGLNLTSSQDASLRRARPDPSGRAAGNRHDASTRNKLRSNSQHGSTLAGTALLLASMPSAMRVSGAGDAGPGSKQPSMHGGRMYAAQPQRSPDRAETSQGGLQHLMHRSLSGAFSLRSSTTFAAQVEQEVSRHKLEVQGLTSQESVDRSQHLQQLQQMQEWDQQDLEETMHMARTHRLTRGVEDDEAAQVALLAVVSYAGAGPSMAVMLDARGKAAEGPAVTALTAATANMTTGEASRTAPLQRQRSLVHDGVDSGLGVSTSFASPPSREARLLAMVAEDEAPARREASANHGDAAPSAFVASSVRQPEEAPASAAPWVSLVSFSRQSSHLVGRVSMPADTAAGDVALARLASMTRQPSQGPGARPGTAAPQDIAGLVRLVSLSRQASQPTPNCSTHGGTHHAALFLLEQACEAAVQGSQSGPAKGGIGVQQAAAVGDEEPDVCGVCLDSGDFVQVQTCGHTICADCASELVRLHEYKAALCPMCRGIIMGFSLPLGAS